MKKVIVLAAAMFLAVAGASAQGKWYIGTSTVGFGANVQGMGDVNLGLFTGVTATDGLTQWGIAPEIGCNLNEKWSVGLGIGFSHYGEKLNAYGFNPYARYFAHRSGDFAFYLQGDVQYVGAAGDGWGETKLNQFSVAVLPGIMYNLSDRFTILASFGSVGYSKIKDVDGIFALKLDASALRFGMAYTF